MLATLILGLFVLQDPAPKQGGEAEKPKAEAPQAAPKKVIETWDDRRAKDAVKAFNKAMKGKPSMRDRNKAVETLATGSNKNLVKPLVKVIERDKSIVIRKRAAELLGNQPPKAATKPILKLLKNGRVTSYPTVQAELIRTLSRCGYEPAMWKAIGGEFERIYELERVPLQEAMLDLVIAHKEKAAIPVLLRNIDEPIPVNVDSPTNPPAEYWEARWKSWRIWRGKVKEALFAITGQRFSTSTEAKIWLKKNRLK